MNARELLLDRESVAKAMIDESHAIHKHWKGSGPGPDEFTIRNMNTSFYHALGALERLGYEVVKSEAAPNPRS